jgi:hypothetical protein
VPARVPVLTAPPGSARVGAIASPSRSPQPLLPPRDCRKRPRCPTKWACCYCQDASWGVRSLHRLRRRADLRPVARHNLGDAITHPRLRPRLLWLLVRNRSCKSGQRSKDSTNLLAVGSALPLQDSISRCRFSPLFARKFFRAPSAMVRRPTRVSRHLPGRYRRSYRFLPSHSIAGMDQLLEVDTAVIFRVDGG